MMRLKLKPQNCDKPFLFTFNPYFCFGKYSLRFHLKVWRGLISEQLYLEMKEAKTSNGANLGFEEKMWKAAEYYFHSIK
jgi:hypothetical protein